MVPDPTSIRREVQQWQLAALSTAVRALLVSLVATNTAVAASNSENSARSSATLPEIAVEGAVEKETASSPVVGYAAMRSATGVKADTPITEVPQSVSVIGAEEIDAKGMRDIEDALNYTPGVSTRTYGHDERGYNFSSIRGFQNGTFSRYLDGIPQLDFIDIAPVTEVFGLERIEVLRGPASATYGQGDVGGIINGVSKRPSLANPIRELRAQFGSFRHKQAAFDYGDRINDTMSFRFVGVKRAGDDQARYPTGESVKTYRDYFAPSFRWQPSAATSVTVLASTTRHSAGDDYGFELDASGNPTNVRQGDPRFSRIVQKGWSVGYEIRHDVNETWGLRQNYRYSDRSVNKRHIRPANLQDDGRTITRGAIHTTGDIEQNTLDSFIEANLRTGVLAHRVIAGVDWTTFKGGQQELEGLAPNLDLYNPIYLPIPSPSTLGEVLGPYRLNSVGTYIQDQMKFGERWLVTLSGRHDDVSGRVAPMGGATDKNRDRALTGRSGITYLAPNGWAPYVSYGTSFQPAIGVYDDFEAKATKGNQWEAGVKFQPANRRLLVTAAVYDLNKTNMIVTDPTTNTRAQVGKMRSRGVELEIKGDITKRLSLTTAFSYTDAEGVKGNTWYVREGLAPVRIPKQLASLWLNYKMTSPLVNDMNVGVGARYVGKRWNDSSNTSRQGGHTLVDASVRYHVNSHWRLAVNATNLFDRRYFSTGLGSWDFGERRTLTATATYTW
ncbi:TonB-dependent siderophore receptor [Pigmentiphaga litoralis]|uniref:Iron complex outermembrane receptor protein n=1 Tax=Pigmentiphaga litoralis TaxID=516702 RepID=A0A7Y9IY31_9BURK|nr:TonB-dependent siderophore receptor [Pigmentiphaga litoralis]NYE25984.1 iron complex outermembrane receptor protein [Pigmentiphaga litoralis]NYE85104.1 iron complex outermembrane receptor protein [Pigmentiphaga litoralis]